MVAALADDVTSPKDNAPNEGCERAEGSQEEEEEEDFAVRRMLTFAA